MQDRIGHHRIIQEIGRGAMGRVWLAHDDVIKRNVAVKELILPETISPEEKQEAIDRFRREAQAAGSLSHPNIVTIYGVEEADGIPFIVMEYLQGSTLAQLLQLGPLSLDRATDIMAQLCEALAYAHAHQIVHRDIKPDNLFVLMDGRLKVTDFGIARVLGTSTVTQIGTVMGTPGYMSPEQVKGERVDWRSDIFSSGVLLFEMLAGRNPFEADSPTSVMYKVVHEDPPPLHAFNPSLPPHLQAVITRACAKDRDARYQDALEIKRDLAGTAPGTVLLASPPTPPPFAPPVQPFTAPPMPEKKIVRATPSYKPPAPPPPPPIAPYSPPVGHAAAAKNRHLSRPALIGLIVAIVLMLAGGVVAIILATSSSKPDTSSKVTVPDLEGSTWEQAQSLAQEAGLAIEKSEVVSSMYTAGEVISQTPDPGQELAKGDTVKVEIAKAGKGNNGDDTDTKQAKDLSAEALINATSILPPDAPGVSYDTYNLVDGLNETCWAEGAPAYGIGEQVIYNFPREVTVTKISCIPGYLKMGDNGQDRWLQNGRLKTIAIKFDDGTQVTYSFQDAKEWQDITINPPKKTRNVTITILDAYPSQSGPNWSAVEDTSVSELHIWGY
jgi:hypothetical protein